MTNQPSRAYERKPGEKIQPVGGCGMLKPVDKRRYLGMRIEDDILKFLKVYAVEHDTTLNDLMNELVIKFVKEHGFGNDSGDAKGV